MIDYNLADYLDKRDPLVQVRQLGDWSDESRWAVYRAFDVCGGLLYVGISSKSVRSRIVEHRRKPWWASVARLEVTYGYTRDEALACEAAAISGEQPLFNVSGVNFGWPRKGGLFGWQYA